MPCAHQPTVEHHHVARATFARCWRCGATGSPVHWPGASEPADAATRALELFARERATAEAGALIAMCVSTDKGNLP